MIILTILDIAGKAPRYPFYIDKRIDHIVVAVKTDGTVLDADFCDARGEPIDGSVDINAAWKYTLLADALERRRWVGNIPNCIDLGWEY